MNLPLPRLAIPGFLAILTAVTGCGQSKGAKDPSAAGGGHAEVGKAAPDLAIQTLNGKGKVSLESLQGKVAVIDFWATWCGPCKQSFPKLEELSKKMGDRVEIVGVSVDDDQKGILDFVKETGVSFAIGWDEGHSLAGRWNVGTMPTTFILDSSGKVRFIHDGYHDGESTLMGKELAGLLDEPASDSGTKVAKADKPPETTTTTAAHADATGSAKNDGKSDGKTETGKTSSAVTADASSSDDKDKADKTADAPPPKKTAKKGGRGASKKAPSKKKKKKPATPPPDGAASGSAS
jgi:thiol-disulfide isomerase/thioredoxin